MSRDYTKMLFQIILLSLLVMPAHVYPEGGQASRGLLHKADSLRAFGDFKQAQKIYKEVFRFDSSSLPALRGLARIAFSKADWGKVKNWNNKLIKINPNARDAHYQLGVAYRETGRFKALLLRKLDFGKSQEHFDTVIHADSSFQDVIYQRGLLERYRHQWTRAIAFGHLQVDIKPGLAHAQTGLFKLYRYFCTTRRIRRWRNG